MTSTDWKVSSYFMHDLTEIYWIPIKLVSKGCINSILLTIGVCLLNKVQNTMRLIFTNRLQNFIWWKFPYLLPYLKTVNKINYVDAKWICGLRGWSHLESVLTYSLFDLSFHFHCQEQICSPIFFIWLFQQTCKENRILWKRTAI